MFEDKVILITGGTGTYGRAFVEYSLKNNFFSKIIIFSRDEHKQFNMKKSFDEKYGEKTKKLRYFIGDVRDKDRLIMALRGVNFCFHAAAMKQILSCRYNPFESYLSNINGTINVINASIQNNVENVIIISSDKSVNPTTYYGTQKLHNEKFGILSNTFSINTKISCLRYGNILGSTSSILDVFLKQDKNLPFSITDRRMTRFFMGIKEAVKLSLEAATSMIGGEIFIKKMKSSNIEKMVRLIDKDKKIVYTKVRPEEKLHEELITEHEKNRIVSKGYDNYYVILPEDPHWNIGFFNHYPRIDNVNLNDFISSTAEKFTDEELLQMINKEKQRLGLSD